jgi:phage terminase large subunit-like protein
MRVSSRNTKDEAWEKSDPRYVAKLLRFAPMEEVDRFLESLDDEEAESVDTDWINWARDEQLPPHGDWRIWLFMGGRGSGKTRAGAEWIAEGVRNGTMNRVALIGATYDEARAVMIEGESGLLKVSGTATFQPANRRVLWPGGAMARVLSADDPDSIRGHQFDAAWCDEFCKWNAPQDALDMALMALRIGENPRMTITTTPRNIAALKKLMTMKDVTITHSTTQDNGANLADGFLAMMEARYAGTRLGRQELDGDLIEDNEAALWRRDWIEASRVREAPKLSRIVVAIDPPVSVTGDECGIVVAGSDAKEECFVLADRSLGGATPAQWARRAIDAFEEFYADSIVAEANQGGEMVRAVLRQELSSAPVHLVHATRDKQTRATPYAALYERGRVHHVGTYAELEDQLCQFDGTGASPDRLDALVWALADLAPMQRQEPKVRTD